MLAKNNEARLHELERLLAQREAELRQAAVVRRALHNAVQELKAQIKMLQDNAQKRAWGQDGAKKDLGRNIAKLVNNTVPKTLQSIFITRWIIGLSI